MEGDWQMVTTVLFLYVVLLPSSVADKLDGNYLHVGFYNKICPQAEQIVTQAVYRAVLYNSSIAAGLIRLHFHDCFVTGCDASILLDTSPLDKVVEKESPANADTLRGLEVIDMAKAQLERECPGIVSCADILAFAARDAAVMAGLLYYLVPGGRRDGRSSRAELAAKLPRSSDSIDKLTKLFNDKGLTQEEMVVLSGAHSIGVAHCASFSDRLRNFDPKLPQDPSMDMLYASILKAACPEPGTLSEEDFRSIEVPLDSLSPFTLDNRYYEGLKMGRGLLSTDQALMNDPNTSKIVKRMALMSPMTWAVKFGRAMTRMGRIDVLTGSEGEIRRSCSVVN